MSCTFAGMTSLTPDSKLHNFVENDQNTTKLCTKLFFHKTRGEFLASLSLLIFLIARCCICFTGIFPRCCVYFIGIFLRCCTYFTDIFSWNIRNISFPALEVLLWNIWKTFLWENVRTFLIFILESSISRNIKNYFRAGFFNFSSSESSLLKYKKNMRLESSISTSNRPEVFCKKVVLRNFTKFTGKYLCQSLRPATLLKKRLWHRCFPANFVKFLRTSFFIERLRWLLLHFWK